MPFAPLSARETIDPAQASADYASVTCQSVTGEVMDIELVSENPSDVVPPELFGGTLTRAGPGRFSPQSAQVNTIDGDGMCARFDFTKEKGKVFYSNKFARTTCYNSEFKCKGAFGTPVLGGWARQNIPMVGIPLFDLTSVKFGNTANTNCIYWENRLIMLWEGGRPHSMDPHTLETFKGEYTFNGMVKKDEQFTAHPKILEGEMAKLPEGKRRLIAIAQLPPPKALLASTTTVVIFDFVEFEPKASTRREVSLGKDFTGMQSIHDFCVTETDVVIVCSPVSLSISRFARGYGADEFIQPGEKGEAHVFLFAREGNGSRVFRMPNQRPFVFHHSTAFIDRATGETCIDSIVYPKFWALKPQALREVGHRAEQLPTLERWRCKDVSTKSRDGKGIVERTFMYGGDVSSFEFPTPHCDPEDGAPLRMWLVDLTRLREDGRMVEPHERVQKLTFGSTPATRHLVEKVEYWQTPPRHFVYEPTFIPAADPMSKSGGFVLLPMHDCARNRAALAILDADTNQTLATLYAPSGVRLPFQFHGNFTRLIPPAPISKL